MAARNGRHYRPNAGPSQAAPGSLMKTMLGTLRTLRFLLAALALTLTACGNDGVGEPCIPENIPPDGFNRNENIVESSSVQCRSRVCIVHKLDGTPSSLCARTPGPTADSCPVKEDDTCRDHFDNQTCTGQNPVQDHVYCTCRCGGDGDTSGFDFCECPDGFECSAENILSFGGAGVAGRYCVRKGVQ